MDPGFDQDEAEFRVFVFAVAFEVFADGYGLVWGKGERVFSLISSLSEGRGRGEDGAYLLDQLV